MLSTDMLLLWKLINDILLYYSLSFISTLFYRCSWQYTALTRDLWHSLDGGCSSQVPPGMKFLFTMLLTMLVNMLLCRCSSNLNNMVLSVSNYLIFCLSFLLTPSSDKLGDKHMTDSMYSPGTKS